jgi:hypothetical protein
LGPGYYDIVEKEKITSRRGMLNALSERFSNDYGNNNPGPGDYGIPDSKLEEKRKNKPGKVALFERSKQERSLPSVGCEVPPGTYNHKNSIDELLKKKVSTRGPYDVFSESRSGPVKWGYFAEDIDKNLGPGQYPISSFTNDLKSRSKEKYGKFGKIAQYPNLNGDRLSVNHTGLKPRNPNWPGPGHYSIPEKLTSEMNKNPPPFNSTSKRSDKRSQKFFTQNFVRFLFCFLKNQKKRLKLILNSKLEFCWCGSLCN